MTAESDTLDEARAPLENCHRPSATCSSTAAVRTRGRDATPCFTARLASAVAQTPKLFVPYVKSLSFLKKLLRSPHVGTFLYRIVRMLFFGGACQGATQGTSTQTLTHHATLVDSAQGANSHANITCVYASRVRTHSEPPETRMVSWLTCRSMPTNGMACLPHVSRNRRPSASLRTLESKSSGVPSPLTRPDATRATASWPSTPAHFLETMDLPITSFMISFAPP
jgi:hypothetical protein